MAEPTELRSRRCNHCRGLRRSGRREGQKRGMAQRSEDGVGKTREMSKRLERAKAKWTRSAISIQASGQVNGRINRPDTRKHLNLRAQSLEKPLASEGASTHGHSFDGAMQCTGLSSSDDVVVPSLGQPVVMCRADIDRRGVVRLNRS